MGETYWDKSDHDYDVEKANELLLEYRYVTDNFEILNTPLEGLKLNDLLLLLDKMNGARDKAKWKRGLI